MNARQNFDVVEVTALPEYPVELVDARLTSDYFTMFWHDRWLNSELCLTAPLDVQGAALNLYFIARKQNPVGSLPDNDDMLAKLLRVDLATWQDLRGRRISPLHGWSSYTVNGKRVLGHSVVIEVALDALTKRVAREASNDERAVKMRQVRLREAMIDIRCDVTLTNDKILIERMDAWLMENHIGQRRMPKFQGSLERAISHAVAQGWVDAASVRGRNR